jgi:7-cyano-7-deazaguanine synthase
MSDIGGSLDIIDISDTLAALGMPRVLIHSQTAIMPFGNAYALSIAVAYAFRMGASRVLIGLHKDDADESREYSRPFVDLVEQLAAYSRKDAPTVETPFIEMTKSQVIEMGLSFGLDYANTWSCIRAGDRHCGVCGACRARRRAFDTLRAPDPTDYAEEPAATASATHG